MRYKSCELLEHGICFAPDAILHCRDAYFSGNEDDKIISDYKKGKVDWNKIIELKKNIREDCKNGKYPATCSKCGNLVEKDWEDRDVINTFLIFNFKKCNCSCSYCGASLYKKENDKFKPYSVVPLLKDLYSTGYMDFDNYVNFNGGEVTDYKEFDDLINYFEENNQKSYFIQSSGVKYSKSIEKILKKGKCELNISLDAGLPETFYNIKNVDAFNNVCNNIKEYNKYVLKTRSLLSVKYVILPNVNDSKHEIHEWLNFCSKNNIKNICIDVVDRMTTEQYINRIPKSIPVLYDYIKEFARIHNIVLGTYAYCKIIIEGLKNGSARLLEDESSVEGYLSCEDFMHTLSFYPEGVRHCMFLSQEHAPEPIIVDNSSDKPLDLDKIFEYKQNVEAEREKGKFKDVCKKCFKAKKQIYSKQNYINQVLISHSNDCNAKCVFCYNHPEEKTEYKPYDVLACLKQLTPYFMHGCEMNFGGGEPTMWNDFDDIINFALENNFYKINISTNGTRFSQKLADALKAQKVSLTVSTDTADAELFMKIKGIDLNLVIDNLKKYIEYDTSQYSIINKFIIIPSVNDTKEQINKWVALNEKLGINNLALDVEALYFNQNREHIDPNIRNLLKYAKNMITDKKLNCILYSFADQMLYDEQIK